MKLKINTSLLAALLSFRAARFTLPMLGTVLASTMTLNLHALDLQGGAGTYDFDATGSYGYTPVGGSPQIIDNSDGTIYFQNSLGASPAITGDMSVNFAGGTYNLFVISRNGQNFGNVGTLDRPVKLGINVTGGTNISFGGGAYGLYSWSGAQSFKVYAETNVDIDTTGTVSFIGLTGEVNNGTGTLTEFIGNTNLTILNGIVGTNTEGGVRDISVMLGSKSINYEGNVTYSFGVVDTSGPSFGGDIYGGLVIPSGNAHRGSFDGNINITLNSGSYKNVYGAGSSLTREHSGSVVINYNGGTIGEGNKIYGTAGVEPTGTKTLNIGGAISSNKIGVSTFDSLNIGSSGALTVNDAVTIGASQNLAIDGNVTIDSGNILTLNGVVDFNVNSAITNNGSLVFGSSVVLDLADIFVGAGEYTLFTGNTSESFNNLALANLRGISGISSITHNVTFNTNGILTIVEKIGQWTIDSAGLDWNTGSTDSSGNSFSATSEVLFTSTTDVTLENNITVAAITLGQNSAVTMLDSGENKLTSTNGITLGDSATLTVNSGVFASTTSITGEANSNLVTTGDVLSAGQFDLSAYTGKLEISSGTYTAAAYNSHSALAEINLGSSTIYKVDAVIAENAAGLGTALTNIKGGTSSTLELKLAGSTSDTPGQTDVVLTLSSGFTGTVHITQGSVNGFYSGFGGAHTLLLDNATFYYNAEANQTLSRTINVQIADGATGYFASDNNAGTIAMKIKGGATSTLRTTDVGSTLTFTGDFSEFLGHIQIGRSNMTLNSSEAANFASIEVNGGRTFTIAGNSVTTSELKVNSGSGTLNINSGASLVLTNGLNTSTGGGTLNLNVNNGASLMLGNQATASTQTINAVLGSNSNLIATDTATSIKNNLNLTGDGRVNLSAELANASVSVDGVISGTGGLNIAGRTGQSFEFNSVNTYTGGTAINANTQVVAESIANLGTGNVTLNATSSALQLGAGRQLVITAANNEGGIIVRHGEPSDNVSDLSNATLVNLNLLLSASQTATLSNIIIEDSVLNVESGASLILNNATIDSSNSLSIAADANFSLADATLMYAADRGTVAQSTSTATTAEGASIDLIYSLVDINVAAEQLSGNLTLNIDLRGASDDMTLVDLFINDLENHIGFELDGVLFDDYIAGEHGAVTLNIMNGNTLLYSDVASGVVGSSAGSAVFYIPEPSTVTMSLLALAGLLARRRRK